MTGAAAFGSVGILRNPAKSGIVGVVSQVKNLSAVPVIVAMDGQTTNSFPAAVPSNILTQRDSRDFLNPGGNLGFALQSFNDNGDAIVTLNSNEKLTNIDSVSSEPYILGAGAQLMLIGPAVNTAIDAMCWGYEFREIEDQVL